MRWDAWECHELVLPRRNRSAFWKPLETIWQQIDVNSKQRAFLWKLRNHKTGPEPVLFTRASAITLV